MGTRPDDIFGFGDVSEQRRLMGVGNRYPSLAEARQSGRARPELTEAAEDLKKIMKAATPKKPVVEEKEKEEEEAFDALRSFEAPVERRASEENQVLAFLRTGKGLRKLI